MLIYCRPEAPAALTLTLADVPSVDDIACAAGAAEPITAFGGRPAELVFIGVHQQGGDGVDALPLVLYRYPTATVIGVGTINDITALSAGLARGAVRPDDRAPLARPFPAATTAAPSSRRNPDHTVTPVERVLLQGIEPRPVQP